ncbi:MAG: hypothetical protein ABR543_10985 [Gemmatimonadaceae bacterium]
MSSREQSAVLATIRHALLAILLLGLVGTLVDLVLLEHTDGFWQQSPLYLLAMGLAATGWHVVHRGPASVRALQATMILLMVSGAIGVLLHYKGNVEFELELHATASGLGLFGEAVRGATPTLAPGTMIQLALIGLAYTYRHPSLGGGSGGAAKDSSTIVGE